MGVVIKQSFWGTVIAYLGIFIGYINALYLRAEYFDLSQIGIFTLVTANAMMISPLSSFGMGSSYLKFFPSFQKQEQNRFFSFIFFITLMGNGLIILLIFFLKDQIAQRYIDSAPLYINFLSITAIIVLSNSLFDLFFSYSRAIMQVIFSSFLRDIYLRFGSLALVFGFAMNWWSFDGAVLGLGIIYFMAFVFLFVQLTIQHAFRFDFRFSIITKEWRMNLLKFGSYSMLLGGSFAVLNNATYDQVTASLGSGANGIYATCFFIALIVELPRRNMAKVVSPILSTEFERKNMVEVGNIYKKSSITMSVIGLLLFIGIITNLNDLFSFIPKGSDFESGFWIVVGVCFVKLILMTSSFAGEIINYSHLYRFNLLFQVIAAVLLLVLNYFLIPVWGLNGAALSYSTAIIIHIILKLGFVKHNFGIHPFVKAHIPLIGIGTLTIISAYFFQPSFHPFINILFRSGLTCIAFVFLIYRFRISTDINKLIHSTFERFLKINLPK